jgi:hypothetical protein
VRKIREIARRGSLSLVRTAIMRSTKRRTIRGLKVKITESIQEARAMNKATSTSPHLLALHLKMTVVL